MTYPVPTHLASLLSVNLAQSDEVKLHGSIICHCGSPNLIPLYVGEKVTNDPNPYMAPAFLRVAKIGEGFFLRLAARCTECGVQHLLFDEHYHGWNGYVCGSLTNRALPRPPYAEWQCIHCETLTHGIELSIIGEDKKTSLEEAGGELTSNDWFNAFGWLDMSVTCHGCGKGPSRIVSFETM